MFGMGKKPTGDESKTDDKLSVYTIPKEFYGGGNPVIRFRNVEKNIGQENPVAAPATIKAAPIMPKAAPSPASPKTAVGFFGNWKLMAISAVGLFVIFLGGAGFYYWRTMQPAPVKTTPKQQPAVTKPNPVPVVATEVPTTSPVIAATSTETVPDASATTTQALDGGVLEFPSILLGSSADLDNDGLTDSEEELFGTDPGKADTDGDGYEDGTEVYNLYSPTVIAPTRLIATDAAKEFLNPSFSYKIYYPSSWAVGNVDPEYRDMLFSTITGENVEVRVFDKQPNQTFEDWFAIWAKGEQLGSLKDFVTVFKGHGRARTDNLVYYFEDDKKIYVILYHVTNSSVVNYRDVITMMARSFRLPSESDAVLPEQKVIRDIPATLPSVTTTPVMPGAPAAP